jgi:hypothetical protein
MRHTVQQIEMVKSVPSTTFVSRPSRVTPINPRKVPITLQQATATAVDAKRLSLFHLHSSIHHTTLTSYFTNPISTHCISFHHPQISQSSMISSSIFLYLALAVSFVSSSPIQRRALSQNDIIGLQLAGYLENLELSLYAGGCKNFDSVAWIAAGFPSTFQQDICAIAEVSVVVGLLFLAAADVCIVATAEPNRLCHGNT